ncbi:chemotaxis protein CheR [Desertifilum sp. FACHB-1129]|uniref:protein-glutamate O-methyltransferase n=1 Tax=Desertifilum tharense IPPAS B-1220 TaxID=1781255 RepID=A0A1E5QKZ7_9CYAN|nr:MULTISPECIES: protein-glutamate O-methyltransferase CheR [Desertifilum]MDA0210238.1 chemotaxis protein CheR [Cyanobacteria bacterium FC1]MBD2310184.1 chemotaxis protein CheR [Desertifilum sp. FACHB-1129]MBD2322560.1 chemotaxis protein CheR [Desertifilum sp. FACHB-866]MBD2334613.1 chemotaxis protein CheR [Desertifilum sp. FACHB-868]OEJ75247.1 chemotaxis protein CheR [Desertifilum tharense IPPAS B-1220]
MAAQKRSENGFPDEQAPDLEEANPEFEILLNYLKHHRGCDLTCYKRSSLMRRFNHRMQSIGIESYPHYLEYLQYCPEEYRTLLDDVLINVTSFFRDRHTWDYLAATIIPQIITRDPANLPIRLWSAGCAGGQEIYSLLILFAEAMGIEACLQRVQAFATDADETAIAQARQATYSPLEIVGLPEELRDKYFRQTQQGYIFNSELRQTVIFSQHDLIQDPPISRIDLLACRNVLIYFNSKTQDAILSRFHFALKSTGFLFLGQAEPLISRRRIFQPIDSSQRVYTKGESLELEDYISLIPPSSDRPTERSFVMENNFWKTAFETSYSARLAVDIKGQLLFANQRARTLFDLRIEDWKRPFQELKIGQLIDSHIFNQSLYGDRDILVLNSIEWKTDEEIQYFNIEISRVLALKNQVLGVNLTFIEINDYQQLSKQLSATRTELASISQALKKSKNELKKANKKLESAYQELEILHQDIYLSHPQSQPSDRA